MSFDCSVFGASTDENIWSSLNCQETMIVSTEFIGGRRCTYVSSGRNEETSVEGKARVNPSC